MYAVDPNKLIKFKIKAGESLPSLKIDRGWSEKDFGDLGEIYINMVPKYKDVNDKAIERSPEERTPVEYVPSASEVRSHKENQRKRRYQSDSDGLFFEWQLLEATGATESKIETAKQAWIDKVTEIKTDIPL